MNLPSALITEAKAESPTSGPVNAARAQGPRPSGSPARSLFADLLLPRQPINESLNAAFEPRAGATPAPVTSAETRGVAVQGESVELTQGRASGARPVRETDAVASGSREADRLSGLEVDSGAAPNNDPATGSIAGRASHATDQTKSESHPDHGRTATQAGPERRSGSVREVSSRLRTSEEPSILVRKDSATKSPAQEAHASTGRPRKFSSSADMAVTGPATSVAHGQQSLAGKAASRVPSGDRNRDRLRNDRHADEMAVPSAARLPGQHRETIAVHSDLPDHREARTETNRPALDPQKWSVQSTRSGERRNLAGGNRGESREKRQDTRGETSVRPEWGRPAIRSTSSREVEGAVRDGLNELVRKARVQIGQGGETSAQIRMNPDHLGFMSVDMKVDQNRVVLKILVDREEILDQLKKDLEVLKGEFSKSGLQIDSVSLKLRESFESAFQNDQDAAQSQLGQGASKEDSQKREDGYFEAAFDGEAIPASASESASPQELNQTPAAFRDGIPVQRSQVAADYDRLLVMNLAAKAPVEFSA